MLGFRVWGVSLGRRIMQAHDQRHPEQEQQQQEEQEHKKDVDPYLALSPQRMPAHVESLISTSR